MIIAALVRGIIVGLLVSVPLGPIGFITINHTIKYGVRRGLIGALIMASIDIVASALSLFGLHHIVLSVHSVPFFIKLVGSAIIFVVGLKLFLQDDSIVKAPQQKHQTILHVILIIVSNPATYLSFGIISILFGPLLIAETAVRLSAFIGFTLASLGWWLTLVFAAEGIKRHLAKITAVHKIIGACIMLSALGILIPSHNYESIRHMFK